MEFDYFAVFTRIQTCVKHMKKSAVVLGSPHRRKHNSEAFAVKWHSSQQHSQAQGTVLSQSE